MIDEIIKLYLEEKLSILSIANKLELGYKKVRNILLKNNITLRKKNTIGLHTHNDKTKEKIRLSKLGDKNPMYGKCSDSTKLHLKKCRDEYYNDPIKKEKLYKKVSQTRIKLGLSKGDKNPMSKPEVVKKWAASNYNNLKPNKKEIMLYNIIMNLSTNFELNTEGKIIIENKIPDIIDIKNKKIVELYGDYWHRDDTIEDEKERIELFKRNNYDCIIIWEKELKNEVEVMQKLSKFIFN
jgi:G:T-mismatch repair DNA endonuclease (very short patch repair protein)